MILNKFHEPVLLNNVLELLKVEKNKVYLDATIGGGGYALEILKKGGKVLGIDKDQDAIKYLKINLSQYISTANLILSHDNFKNLDQVLESNGIKQVAGMIFDLGISSYQLEKSKRGFSYLKNEVLDMRFDRASNVTAIEIINYYSKEELYEIFTKNSEELNSRSIADAIYRARSLNGKISSTFELNEIIQSIIPNKNNRELNKCLSRIYQALRIEVNSELINLKIALKKTINLQNAGRLVLISYHSLEDRIVKKHFADFENENLMKIITKKPITPDYEEFKKNSRSRSAKLRAAEKL